MTQTMGVTDAREQWRELINAVFQQQQSVILEEGGIPVAALVSVEALNRLRRYDAERGVDFAVLGRIGAAFADVPDEELEREVAKAVNEVRAELRAERERAARSA